MPSFTLKAYPAQINNIFDIFQFILAVLTNLIPVVVGLTVIVFLWGLFKLLMSAGNESDYNEGRNIMIYGIIGLFVTSAIGGLVVFLQGSFGFSGLSSPQ